MASKYPGNCQTPVNKDAKYSVKREDGEWVVKLLFTLDQRERLLLPNELHPELVEMVNAVKRDHAGTEGGAFYVNEFDHVLVPTPDGVLFAGSYEERLEFVYDDGNTKSLISPRAPDDLSPGDVWSGPHVGRPHVITANEDDIYYKEKTPRSETQVHLSDEIGEPGAKRLASRLGNGKGGGGRFYINECGEFFGPPPGGGQFLYLGSLDEDPWFPMPQV